MGTRKTALRPGTTDPDRRTARATLPPHPPPGPRTRITHRVPEAIPLTCTRSSTPRGSPVPVTALALIPGTQPNYREREERLKPRLTVR